MLSLWPSAKLVCLGADEKQKFDELVEDQGVRILIEPTAIMHVLGTKMDFVEDRLKCALPSLVPCLLSTLHSRCAFAVGKDTRMA